MVGKRFYTLTIITLLTLVAIAVVGVISSTANLLFTVLLALIGGISGYLTNAYFAEKSAQQNLGRYGIAGNRLSLDVYDTVNEIIQEIDNIKITISEHNERNTKEFSLILDNIAGRLLVLRRFALSANNQWRDVLPPAELAELSNRERLFELSEKHDIEIVEEKHVLQSQ